MLDKLSRETSRLQQARTMEDATDHAINCALTAWHLADWVWVAHFRDDPTARQRIGLAACGHDRKLKREFNKYVADQSPELRLCEDIANGFKHVVAKPPRGAKHPGASGVRTEGISKIIDGSGLRDGWGAFTVETKYVAWITDDAGNQQEALKVYHAVREFWDDFLSGTNNNE